MRDTLNGIILVGMLVVGVFAFYIVGELRQPIETVPVAVTVPEQTAEEEVARTEAETLEAHILAERAEHEERKTKWFASE